MDEVNRGRQVRIPRKKRTTEVEDLAEAKERIALLERRMSEMERFYGEKIQDTVSAIAVVMRVMLNMRDAYLVANTKDAPLKRDTQEDLWIHLLTVMDQSMWQDNMGRALSTEDLAWFWERLREMQ